MKASLAWLRELVPGLTIGADEVARALTAVGLEVESTAKFGAGLENVVVARVLEVGPHPTKSGLRLVTVDRGTGTQTVVCGAPNVPGPGGLVVLALLGAHLPAKGMTIAARAVGGVTSEGMLCSPSELGIGGEGGGIWILPEGTAAPGTPIQRAYPSADDAIFEIGVTPNRPDALGHFGIARDLSAKLGLPASLPAARASRVPGRVADTVAIRIEDEVGCPFYGASILIDATDGPSPLWLQHRLFALGMRPISAIVDVTNLVMLERAQPLHAFDADTLRGGAIVVRRARAGEKLKTLDGVDRELFADDLIIADAERPIALAGVMGGAETEISASTKRILLECAYFDPRSVRRTAKRHGLHTEASHRFERGIDRRGQREALERAEAWLAELTGAQPLAEPSHVEVGVWEAPRIHLRRARAEQLLGVAVDLADAAVTLERLGCAVEKAGDALAVIAPSFRPDLTREADLIEEVVRIRGLDDIPDVLPPIVPQRPERTHVLESKARAAAVELGLSEVLAYSFVAPKELAAIQAEPSVVSLLSPLTVERSVMRTSILPGLLETVRHARRHGERSARLFSLGRTFHAPAPGSPLPTERRRLGVLLAGPRPTYLAKPEDHDVFDAKGIAEEIVPGVTRRRPVTRALGAHERPPHLHPRGAGVVEVGGHPVATLGPLHPDVIENTDLGGGAVVVEIDLDALDAVGTVVPKAEHVPRLPATTRDVAFVAAETVPARSIEHMIREAAGDLCEDVALFDMFRGEGVGDGKRSLAFRVTYRDERARRGEEGGRTLTDAEVDARHGEVVRSVRERLGAELRGA